MSKQYYISFIDDVIWALRDVTRERPKSLFDNPFFKIFKNAHDMYGLKIQFNLFYRTDYYYGMDEFTLADMTDAYKEEFKANSDWLKLSFHAKQEFPDYPHVNASYEDICELFTMTKNEVIRFAGEKSFGLGIIPHWLPVSLDGCRALYDCGAKVVGATAGIRTQYGGDPSTLPYGHAGRLLQNRKPETMLFTRETKDAAIASSLCAHNHLEDPALYYNDKVVKCVDDEKTGLKFKGFGDNFDINLYSVDEIKAALDKKSNDELIYIGNHEQYFYKEYFAYQPEYEEKIYTVAKTLKEAGRTSLFIEELAEFN